MEIKETSKSQLEESSIIENVDYYKYIFKKTEKIVCAVFYILRSDKSIPSSDITVRDLEACASDLLNVTIKSLQGSTRVLHESAIDIRHRYIDLEAKLRLANAAQIVSTELLVVFLHEIDSVQRSLQRYTHRAPLSTHYDEERVRKQGNERRVQRTRIDAGVSQAEGSQTMSAVVSRREKVIQVIREKGQATIKDISDVVKDCSEKTIQRELVSLINDNVVVREGDRRWSRYCLV